MTDDEIVRRITQQYTVAVILQTIGRRDKAQLFTNHVLRLIYTHRLTCTRWMAARKPSAELKQFTELAERGIL